MACEPGEEERLTALAAELDATIGALKARIGEIGDRRIAVMAGLSVLDRLKASEARCAELERRVEQLEKAREAAALAAEEEDEPLIARLDAAAAALERLTATLNAQTHTLSEDEADASFSRARRGVTGSLAPGDQEDVTGGTEGASGARKDPSDEPSADETETSPAFMQRN